MKMVGTILTIYLQLYTPSEALETIKVSSVRPVTSALPGILGGGRYIHVLNYTVLFDTTGTYLYFFLV